MQSFDEFADNLGHFALQHSFWWKRFISIQKENNELFIMLFQILVKWQFMNAVGFP